MIGGGSPLKRLTKLQAEAILKYLSFDYPNLRVYEAYSYSKPYISDTISELARGDYEKIIALPLYPHYSRATLGSVYSDLEKASRRHNLESRLKVVQPFFENPQFIKASAEMLEGAMSKIDAAVANQVIFSAHALPQSFIDKGDPYRNQVEKTVSLILKEFPVKNWALAFQSKIGPVNWMKPSTIEAVRMAGRQGIKELAVIPVGFVCDHIETLYELDIELAEIAKAVGIRKFVRGEVFNTHPAFVKLLADLIEQELR